MIRRFILRRAIRLLLLLTAFTLIGLYNHNVNADETMRPISSLQDKPVEELFVEGERPDPTSFALHTMEVIYYHKARAARDFKLGRYEKAFPALRHLAKMGFKDEQARLAYIYLHGLGNQTKSNMRALAWLGTATTGTTRPQYRNLYKQLIAQVPAEHLGKVTQIVRGYQDQYGAEVSGVTCQRSRTGHLDNLTCLFDQQRNKHIDRLMSLAKTGQVPWVLSATTIEESFNEANATSW